MNNIYTEIAPIVIFYKQSSYSTILIYYCWKPPINAVHSYYKDIIKIHPRLNWLRFISIWKPNCDRCYHFFLRFSWSFLVTQIHTDSYEKTWAQKKNQLNNSNGEISILITVTSLSITDHVSFGRRYICLLRPRQSIANFSGWRRKKKQKKNLRKARKQ